MIGLICLFTIPFTRTALWLWASVSGDPAANWRSIGMAVVIIVAGVTFITHIYETLFLVREWDSDRVRNDRLQRLNLEAELLALKSEVNRTRCSTTSTRSATSCSSATRARRRLSARLASSYRYLLRTGQKRWFLFQTSWSYWISFRRS